MSQARLGKPGNPKLQLNTWTKPLAEAYVLPVELGLRQVEIWAVEGLPRLGCMRAMNGRIILRRMNTRLICGLRQRSLRTAKISPISESKATWTSHAVMSWLQDITPQHS